MSQKRKEHSPNKKIRFNLGIEPESDTLWRKVEKKMGAASLTETLRRTAKIMDFLLTRYEKDGFLILKNPKDGSEERVLIS